MGLQPRSTHHPRRGAPSIRSFIADGWETIHSTHDPEAAWGFSPDLHHPSPSPGAPSIQPMIRREREASAPTSTTHHPRIAPKTPGAPSIRSFIADGWESMHSTQDQEAA